MNNLHSQLIRQRPIKTHEKKHKTPSRQVRTYGPQMSLTLATQICRRRGMVKDPSIAARLRAVLENLPLLRQAFPDAAPDAMDKVFMALTIEEKKFPAETQAVQPGVGNMPTYLLGAATHQSPTAKRRSPYEGLSAAEAAVEYMSRLSKKRPVTCLEIAGGLAAEGYESAAENPDMAYRAALVSRMANYDDVVRVGRGKFALREWYPTPQDLAIEQHRARTKEGQDQRRARGRRVGAEMKIDLAKAESMFRDGMSVEEVRMALKLKSKSTIYKYFKKNRVRELYDEGRRSRESSVDDIGPAKPSLRVVGGDTYPRSDEEA